MAEVMLAILLTRVLLANTLLGLKDASLMGLSSGK